MDVNHEKISALLDEIELVRRRRIADYKSLKDISYIDPDHNIEKLLIHNNHLIFGRRGSGKTTLLLKVIEKGKDSLPVIQDLQTLRKFDAYKITIMVLQSVLNEINDYFVSLFIEVQKEYRKKCKGFRGLVNRIKGQYSNEQESIYKRYALFHETLNTINQLLDSLKDSPNETAYRVTLKSEKSNSWAFKTSNKFDQIAQIDVGGSINLKYKSAMAKLSSTLSIVGKCAIEQQVAGTLSSQVSVVAENQKILSKESILTDLKENLTFLFNEFYILSRLRVVLYLDDFYQIPLENQPFVLQYLHDIYKTSIDSSFCFKVCSLPNRIRMNMPGETDFSHKDDFSPIKLDNDLSQLESLKDYLIRIICNLKADLELTKQDIASVFNNDEVIVYSVIATGGIPRDFIVMFADLVRTARSDNRGNITKEHVYSVVKSFKDDKDNNIEYDADLDSDIVRQAIGIIAEDIVNKLNTNVVLYPKRLVSQHELLLKNLVNLRYLHIIKDSVSSENVKKEEFVAYLVDMIFYATNRRMKQGFQFRKFWEMDSESRLTELRNAPVWSFPESIIEQLPPSNI